MGFASVFCFHETGGHNADWDERWEVLRVVNGIDSK